MTILIILVDILLIGFCGFSFAKIAHLVQLRKANKKTSKILDDMMAEVKDVEQVSEEDYKKSTPEQLLEKMENTIATKEKLANIKGRLDIVDELT